MVALLVVIMATLEIWPKKKTVGRKGPFAVNVFKNPARNVKMKYCDCKTHFLL